MKNKIQPIVTPKAYEVVRDRIIDMLQSGEYAEGDLLPTEAELASAFQLGRSSIREAFKSLQLAGLVSSTPGKGTFVAPNAMARLDHMRLGDIIQDETNIAQLAEARLMIEPEMARHAALRRETADLEKMADSIEKMRQSQEKKALLSHGHRFHQAVCTASKNDVMIGMHNSISMQLYRMRQMDELTVGVYQRGIGEHQQIYDAIVRQDAENAARLMREHLLKDYSKYLK